MRADAHDVERSVPPRRREGRLVHVVTGVAVAAVGLLALAQARGLDFYGSEGEPGPGFFPRLVAALLVVLGLLLAVTRFLGWPVQPERVERPTRSALARSLGLWLGFAASVPLLPRLGLVLTAVLLAAYALFVVERLRGLAPLVAVVLIPVVAWLVFIVALGVQLPAWPGGT